MRLKYLPKVKTRNIMKLWNNTKSLKHKIMLGLVNITDPICLKVFSHYGYLELDSDTRLKLETLKKEKLKL